MQKARVQQSIPACMIVAPMVAGATDEESESDKVMQMQIQTIITGQLLTFAKTPRINGERDLDLGNKSKC